MRFLVSMLALATTLAACERRREERWWDPSPPPPPARELRVLAPSGRLAPSAWQATIESDGAALLRSVFDPFLVVALPEGARRVQVRVPGCAPLDLEPGAGRTLARLVMGPRVRLRFGLPSDLDPVERRLHVTLLPVGEKSGAHKGSLSAAVLAQQQGFTTAGTPVPREATVELCVPAPGPYFLLWTVERTRGRASYSDSRGQQIHVSDAGSQEPIDVPLPDHILAWLR